MRVTVTIGATTWDTSIFPDSTSESFVLPVEKQVRAGENLHDGDTVAVTLDISDPA